MLTVMMRAAINLLSSIALLTACGASDPPSSMGGSDADAGASDAASSRDASSADAAPASEAGGESGARRGFPIAGPWVSFYGGASGVDLAKVAARFRIINVDVDPDGVGFTDAQIQTLRAGGQNRVISYTAVQK
jgi:cysteinyl-tRNA synthetase